VPSARSSLLLPGRHLAAREPGQRRTLGTVRVEDPVGEQRHPLGLRVADQPEAGARSGVAALNRGLHPFELAQRRQRQPDDQRVGDQAQGGGGQGEERQRAERRRPGRRPGVAEPGNREHGGRDDRAVGDQQLGGQRNRQQALDGRAEREHASASGHGPGRAQPASRPWVWA
jgi:hypothetical protein